MSEMHSEDLFEQTKMSFGDHLEELRVCLVRAMLGLAVGFAIGLSVAGPVVNRIEGPLEEALAKYHQQTMRDQLTASYGTNVPEALLEFMEVEALEFEDIYFEREELRRFATAAEDRETKAVAPGTSAASPVESSPVESSTSEADDSETGPTDTPTDNGADKTSTDDKVKVTVGPGAPSTDMVKTRIWRPMDTAVTSLSAHEPFMIWLKAAVITGAVIASPWIFFQLWTFIAAGLYPQEKSYVYFFLPVSLGLFFSGAALAFFFVFEPVLDFLFKFNRMMNIDPYPRISDWMSFVLFLPLGFGISFQLPLVMLVVERIGIVSVSSYLEKWRIAVLIIFVISMLLTPADPISMLLMAVPLTILYFGGIAMCQYLPKRSSPYGEGYDPQ